MVFRLCTERVLLKSLREWDQYAWCEGLGWGVRTNWNTMFSVVEKLTSMEEECLNILFETFFLDNLRRKFYKIKAEKRQTLAARY